MIPIDRLSEISKCEFRGHDTRIIGSAVSIMLTCNGTAISPEQCLKCNA